MLDESVECVDSGTGFEDVTVASFSIVPDPVGINTTVLLAVAPILRSPNRQVTSWAPEAKLHSGLAEAKLNSAGRLSIMVTAVDVEIPMFVTSKT